MGRVRYKEGFGRVLVGLSRGFRVFLGVEGVKGICLYGFCIK